MLFLQQNFQPSVPFFIVEYSYREIMAASRGSCIRVTNGDRDIMTCCYFYYWNLSSSD